MEFNASGTQMKKFEYRERLSGGQSYTWKSYWYAHDDISRSKVRLSDGYALKALPLTLPLLKQLFDVYKPVKDFFLTLYLMSDYKTQAQQERVKGVLNEFIRDKATTQVGAVELMGWLNAEGLNPAIKEELLEKLVVALNQEGIAKIKSGSHFDFANYG